MKTVCVVVIYYHAQNLGASDPVMCLCLYYD